MLLLSVCSVLTMEVSIELIVPTVPSSDSMTSLRLLGCVAIRLKSTTQRQPCNGTRFFLGVAGGDEVVGPENPRSVGCVLFGLGVSVQLLSVLKHKCLVRST